MELPERRCDYCGEVFTPHRPWQRFCKEDCRSHYHQDRPEPVGSLGQVRSVRRIRKGTSVTVHFYDHDEAERAIRRFRCGTEVRVADV